MAISRVWRDCFNGVDESLVEKCLSYVTHALVPDSVVLLCLGVFDVGDDVQVCCSSDIVAWEIGFELDDTVTVCLLDTAEESFVKIRLVVHAAVAVDLSESTAVDTCGVCAWGALALAFLSMCNIGG